MNEATERRRDQVSRGEEEFSAPFVAPVITGTGLITPLGFSTEETWSSLMEGRWIRDHARVTLQLPEHEDRATSLAICAAREAVTNAGWSGHLGDDTSLVVGTSKGPVETWIAPAVARICNPCGFGLGGIVTSVAQSIGLGLGPRLMLSAACASGLHALIRAAMLIGSGEARRVLVVATEASVHPLFLGSFKRLGVLPPEGHGCRPLDETRAGFLMSEAAAAVCLEASSPSPGTPGEGRGEGSVGKDEGGRMKDEATAAHPSSFILHPSAQQCRLYLDAFAFGGDATHLTGGDPEGRTLRHLLQRVAGQRPVDLVHAHATGTKLNDPVELSAAESEVKGSPNVYSHKGALGHSLGAAGLVSIVLNCFMHRYGVIPPNVRTTRPIASRLPICDHAVSRPIRRSIAIAAGFGGPTAVVGLRSTPRAV